MKFTHVSMSPVDMIPLQMLMQQPVLLVSSCADIVIAHRTETTDVTLGVVLSQHHRDTEQN